MTATGSRTTNGTSPAGTIVGWLLIVAALGVNAAVYLGEAARPWVWAVAVLVVVCAGVQRARHRHH